MLTRSAFALSGGVVLTAVAILAAPGQVGTDRPGQPTQGKVWVENRGRDEAVPVVLQEVATSMPMGVRFVRQPWEYRTLSVPPGQDLVKLLASAGMEGWEATGLQMPNQSGTVLLLKRPR